MAWEGGEKVRLADPRLLAETEGSTQSNKCFDAVSQRWLALSEVRIEAFPGAKPFFGAITNHRKRTACLRLAAVRFPVIRRFFRSLKRSEGPQGAKIFFGAYVEQRNFLEENRLAADSLRGYGGHTVWLRREREWRY